MHRAEQCTLPGTYAPAFPTPEPKPEVAASIALPRPEPKTCLGTVEDLALQAHRKVENVTWERRQRIQQQVEEPCGSSRFAAYDSLRTVHKGCELCMRKEACALGWALLIMRDLLVLTVAIEQKGPMTPETLKTALNEALRQGCPFRFDMDKTEQAQLALAFHKVIDLGRTREGFDEKVRSPHMYGHDVTVEEVEQLFLEYNLCARASPHYLSKTKESRKHK